MVDAERLGQVELADGKKKWKTQKGFVYPVPRKAADYAVHPNKPSQSRIDILSEEWVENESHPEDIKQVFDFKPGQVDFNTVPSNGKGIFGGYDKPKFTRDFVSADVGSSTTLPRGKIVETKNPGFFNSVHLVGPELYEEELAQKQAAQDLWKSKVCVDSLDFLVGGFVQKSKPDQLSRVSDILHGPALKKSLLIVRNAKLPSGKAIPLRPPPYSIFSKQPYADPKDFTADLRPNDASTFLATNPVTGGGEDFFRYINDHTGKAKSQTFVSKSRIMPLNGTEHIGDPRW
jgi:hypothetical protein